MASPENVDSGGPIRPLWRVTRETFSRTYSAIKIAQTRIVEPIHPLLNKKMLVHLSAGIISSTRNLDNGMNHETRK